MSQKSLVAYFSASGQTARVAKAIAAAIGADLFEIRPEQPYSAADLDWTNKKSRSSVEMNDPTCRPAMAEVRRIYRNMSAIFLGFPIWWYVEPRIVDTFLESQDISGKAFIPFATSGGSGIDGAVRNLQKSVSAGCVESGQIGEAARTQLVGQRRLRRLNEGKGRMPV